LLFVLEKLDYGCSSKLEAACVELSLANEEFDIFWAQTTETRVFLSSLQKEEDFAKQAENCILSVDIKRAKRTTDLKQKLQKNPLTYPENSILGYGDFL